MKKNLLTITFIAAVLTSLNAQFFQGLRSSSYGGVTNVSYNPAIADNHFIADINLIGLGATVSNNYVGVDRRVILKKGFINSNLDFKDAYLKERVNGKDKSAYVGLQVQGPLSFMCTWGEKERKNINAFAFTWNFNSVTNADQMDETFVRAAYHGVGYLADSITGFRGKTLKDVNPSAKSLNWIDYGFTYSRVAYEKGDHFVKAGGTLKLLQGIGAGYVYVKNLDYKWENYDTLSIFKSEAGYAYSEGTVSSKGYSPDDISDYAKDLFSFKYSSPSVGVDLGAIYEWRPDKDKYKYQMDCKDEWMFDKNRYKVAAGISIIDIGAIRFQKGQYSGNLTADTRDWDVANAKFDDGLQSIDDSVAARFKFAGDGRSHFTMWLPMRINLFVDYNIAYGFGVNMAGSIAPTISPKRNAVHHLSNFSITPKYDHTWFGFYLPFSIDQFANPNLGVTLRMGPLTVGMGDILGLFAKKYVFNTDIHMSLKVTIPYMKKGDKDKDGVSNKKDKCKNLKGECETFGCPDRDHDGITDPEDKCPDVPGPKEFQGCPDTDGDSIIDMEDSCVFDKGPLEFHGCPDRDGDKIIDKLDECPDAPGLAEFNGCPDRDADGTPDKTDLCPDVVGPKDHFGCPDTDGDGIYDNEDQCVNTPGPKENAGCPWPDKDNDGVLDKDDACPTVFGVPENKGCPKLEKKEIETLKMAFENLEFETGKDVIRTHSFASLNSLAQLLVKKANYGLRIDGHTDNVGKDENNMILSQKRADAVKNYLVKKGVEAGKLETHGYGETMPIADNATTAGKQKNRRVEMKITFR